MKKIFVILVVALAATLNLSAQNEWKNEIGVSYGFGTFTDMSSSYLKGIFSGKQTNYIGAFGAEYFHRPNAGALGVGLVGTFSTCKWNDSDKARTKYISIMPAVKYNWMNREHISLYSKVALGVLIGMENIDSQDKTKAAFAWQASVLGAEFGSAFRGFLELGFGEQGLVVAGLRYKF